MTRPDYCPVAQEPCQAMCVQSDVRCMVRDTAPQRQPLTDEEIMRTFNEECRRDTQRNEVLTLARAIERKHGIGGEA